MRKTPNPKLFIEYEMLWRPVFLKDVEVRTKMPGRLQNDIKNLLVHYHHPFRLSLLIQRAMIRIFVQLRCVDFLCQEFLQIAFLIQQPNKLIQMGQCDQFVLKELTRDRQRGFREITG